MATEIQQMLAALGQLHDDIAAKLPAINAAIVQAQAAYAALATNLKGVIQSESYYIANVDPDGVYDPRSGGTFQTLRQAISSAHGSSFVIAKLASNKPHVIDADIPTRNQKIYIQSAGLATDTEATRPIIAPTAYLYGGLNTFYQFAPSMSSDIHIVGCNVALPGPVDAGVSWSWKAALVTYMQASHNQLGIERCKVTGQSAATGLMSCAAGSTAKLALYNAELSGPLTAIMRASGGVAQIASVNLTLSNGAVLTDAGTICTGNIIKN